MYDYVIIGAGIAGVSISHFLESKKTLLIDSKGVCQGASGAAGAFLFPKIGYDTKYTRFVNDALLFSLDYYRKLLIPMQHEGVLLLPRDENDIPKFTEYAAHIKLPYEKRDEGYFFPDGAVVSPTDVGKGLTQNTPFFKTFVKKIHKDKNIWLINDQIATKNIILTTGYRALFPIPYIFIHSVWGERIEIETEVSPEMFIHKNCSISKNRDGILKIGATHERRKTLKPVGEGVTPLITKANEAISLDRYKLLSVKGGMRAASNDFFPVIGEVIDTQKMLHTTPNLKNGVIPKEWHTIKGLYTLNGGGGRGFSNYLYGAHFLSRLLLEKRELPSAIDTKRLFIKWARKKG